MALPMEETGSLRIIRFAVTIAIAVILASAIGEMMEPAFRINPPTRSIFHNPAPTIE
jgi:FlaG/FlaF family flagellin (archaellin)